MFISCTSDILYSFTIVTRKNVFYLHAIYVEYNRWYFLQVYLFSSFHLQCLVYHNFCLSFNFPSVIYVTHIFQLTLRYFTRYQPHLNLHPFFMFQLPRKHKRTNTLKKKFNPQFVYRNRLFPYSFTSPTVTLSLCLSFCLSRSLST